MSTGSFSSGSCGLAANKMAGAKKANRTAAGRLRVIIFGENINFGLVASAILTRGPAFVLSVKLATSQKGCRQGDAASPADSRPRSPHQSLLTADSLTPFADDHRQMVSIGVILIK